MFDLRCASGTLFAVVTGDSEVEVRCRKPACGYRPGVLVLHRFDIRTGAVLGTKVYQDAVLLKEEVSGTDRHSVAVRSA